MCQTNGIRSSGETQAKIQNVIKKGMYVDEALAKTRFGVFNYILILNCGLILNAVFLETCGISFVIPVSQCDLKLTSKEKGILGAASFVGIICSSHLWGFLADTTGRKRVIQPTLLVAFLLSIISSFTNNFPLFVTLRFLNGFFISGSAATMYAYLGEFHNNTQRGRAIMGSALIFGVSCLLLPLIAWSVINQDWEFEMSFIDVTYKPWRLFIVVCSLPGFIASLVLIFFPESPKFVLGLGNQIEAIKILEQMNRWNNGKNAELSVFEIYEEAESIENRRRILENKNNRFPLMKSVWSQTAPLFRSPYLATTVLICTIQFGIYATSTGFYMFFADILNRMAQNLGDRTEQRIKMCDVINMKNMTEHLSEEIICVTKLELATLEQGIVLESLYAIGFAVIGVLINKVGKFPILLVVLVGSGAGGIICMLTNIPSIQVYSFIALLCCGMAGNVVNAATVELYPTSSRAMAIAMSMIFGRLGSVVGSNLIAYLLNKQCEIAFYLSGSSVIGCAVLTYFIPNIHQKISKKGSPRSSTISTRS